MIMKRPKGLIPVLDEECMVPKGSWEGFVSKFTKHQTGNARLKPRNRGTELGIVHYAGEVFYDPSLFMVKNKDTLSQDLVEVFSSATNGFVMGLFDEAAIVQREASVGSFRKGMEDDGDDSVIPRHTSGAPKRSSMVESKQTVGKKFSLQLESLMKNLNATKPRYIRCVKPNQQKRPNIFVHHLTNEQLTYSGVFEAVIIMQNGYPFRLNHAEFRDSYHMLVQNPIYKPLLWNTDLFEAFDKSDRKHLLWVDENAFRSFSRPFLEGQRPRSASVISSTTFSRKQCETMVLLLGKYVTTLNSRELFTGVTKIFYRANEHRVLLEMRERMHLAASTKIQATARRYLVMQITTRFRSEARLLLQAIHTRNVEQLLTSSSILETLNERLQRACAVQCSVRVVQIGRDYVTAIVAETKCTEKLTEFWNQSTISDEDKLNGMEPIVETAKNINFQAVYQGISLSLRWTDNPSLVDYVEKVRILRNKVEVTAAFKTGLAEHNEVALEVAIKRLETLRAMGDVSDASFLQEEQTNAALVIRKAEQLTREFVETFESTLPNGACRLISRSSGSGEDKQCQVDPEPLQTLLSEYAVASSQQQRKPYRVTICLNAAERLIQLRSLASQGLWQELWAEVSSIDSSASSSSNLNALTHTALSPSTIRIIEQELKVMILASVTFFLVPRFKQILVVSVIAETPFLELAQSTTTTELENQLGYANQYKKYFDAGLSDFVLRMEEHLLLRQAVDSGNITGILAAISRCKRIPPQDPDMIHAKFYEAMYQALQQLSRILDAERWQGESGSFDPKEVKYVQLETWVNRISSVRATGLAWSQLISISQEVLQLKRDMKNSTKDTGDEIRHRLAVLLLPKSQLMATISELRQLVHLPELQQGLTSVVTDLELMNAEIDHYIAMQQILSAFEKDKIVEDINLPLPTRLSNTLEAVIESNMGRLLDIPSNKVLLDRLVLLQELRTLVVEEQFEELLIKMEKLPANFDQRDELYASQFSAVNARLLDYKVRKTIQEKLHEREIPTVDSNYCILHEIIQQTLRARVELTTKGVADLKLAKAFLSLRCAMRDGHWEPVSIVFFGRVPTLDLPAMLTGKAESSLNAESKSLDRTLSAVRGLDSTLSVEAIEDRINALKLSDLSVAEVLLWLKHVVEVPDSCAAELEEISNASLDRRVRAIMLMAASSGRFQGNIDKVNHRTVRLDDIKTALVFAKLNLDGLSAEAVTWYTACELLVKVRETVIRVYSDLRSSDPSWRDSLHDHLDENEIASVIQNVSPGFPVEELALVADKVTDLRAFEELEQAVNFGAPQFVHGKFDTSRVQFDHLVERLDLAKKVNMQRRSDRLDRFFFYLELIINLRAAVTANQWDLSERGEQRKAALDKYVVSVKRCLTEYVQAQKFFRTPVIGVPPQNIKNEFALVEREWERRLTIQRFNHAFKSGAIAGSPLHLLFHDVRIDLLENEVQRALTMESDSGEVDIDVSTYVTAARELIDVRKVAMDTHKQFRSHCQFSKPTNSLKAILGEQAFLPDCINKAVGRIDEIQKTRFEARKFPTSSLDNLIQESRACLKLPFDLVEIQLMLIDVSERSFIAEVLLYVATVEKALESEATMKQTLHNLQHIFTQYYQRQERYAKFKQLKNFEGNLWISQYLHDSAMFLIHFLRAKISDFYDPPDRDWKRDLNQENTPRLQLLQKHYKTGRYTMQQILRAAAKCDIHQRVQHVLRIAEAEIEDRISSQELEIALKDESFTANGSVGRVVISERAIKYAEGVLARIESVVGSRTGSVKQMKVLLDCINNMRLRILDRRYQDVLTTAAKFIHVGNKDLEFMSSILYESADGLSLGIAQREFMLLAKEACDKLWQQQFTEITIGGGVRGSRGVIPTFSIQYEDLQPLLKISEVMLEKSYPTTLLTRLAESLYLLRLKFLEIFAKPDLEAVSFHQSKVLDAKVVKILEDSVNAGLINVLELGAINWHFQVDKGKCEGLMEFAADLYQGLTNADISKESSLVDVVSSVKEEVNIIQQHVRLVSGLRKLYEALRVQYFVLTPEGLVIQTSYDDLAEAVRVLSLEDLQRSGAPQEAWVAEIFYLAQELAQVMTTMIDDILQRKSFTIEPGSEEFVLFRPRVTRYLQHFCVLNEFAKRPGCQKFAFPLPELELSNEALSQAIKEHSTVLMLQSIIHADKLIWYEREDMQLVIDLKRIHAIPFMIQEDSMVVNATTYEEEASYLGDVINEEFEEPRTTVTKELKAYTLSLIRFRSLVAQRNWARADEVLAEITSTTTVHMNTADFEAYKQFLVIMRAKRKLEYEILLCTLPDIPYWSLFNNSEMAITAVGKGLDRFMRGLVDGSAEPLPKFKVFEELTEMSYQLLELMKGVKKGFWISAPDIAEFPKHKLFLDATVKDGDQVTSFWYDTNDADDFSGSVFNALSSLQQLLAQSKTLGSYVKQLMQYRITLLQIEFLAVQLEHVSRQVFEKIEIHGIPGELMIVDNLVGLNGLIHLMDKFPDAVHNSDRLRQAYLCAKCLYGTFMAHREGDVDRLVDYVNILLYCHQHGQPPRTLERKQNARLKTLTQSFMAASDAEFEAAFAEQLDFYTVRDHDVSVPPATDTSNQEVLASIRSLLGPERNAGVILAVRPEITPLIALLEKHCLFESLHADYVKALLDLPASGSPGEAQLDTVRNEALEKLLPLFDVFDDVKDGYVSLLFSAVHSLHRIRAGQIAGSMEMVKEGIRQWNDSAAYETDYETPKGISFFGGKAKTFTSLVKKEVEFAEEDMKQRYLIRVLREALDTPGIEDDLTLDQSELEVELLVEACNVAVHIGPKSDTASRLYDAALHLCKVRRAITLKDWETALNIVLSCYDVAKGEYTVYFNVDEFENAWKLCSLLAVQLLVKKAYQIGKIAPSDMSKESALEGDDSAFISSEYCQLALTAADRVQEKWLEEDVAIHLRSCEVLLELRNLFLEKRYELILERLIAIHDDLTDGHNALSGPCLEEMEAIKDRSAYHVVTAMFHRSLTSHSLRGAFSNIDSSELSIDELIASGVRAWQINFHHADVDVLQRSAGLIYRLRRAQLNNRWVRDFQALFTSQTSNNNSGVDESVASSITASNKLPAFWPLLEEKMSNTTRAIIASEDDVKIFVELCLDHVEETREEYVEDLLEDFETLQASTHLSPLILSELELSYHEFRYRQIVMKLVKGMYSAGYEGTPGDIREEGGIQIVPLQSALEFAQRFPSVMQCDECSSLVRDAKLLLDVRKFRVHEDYLELNDAIQRAEEHNLRVIELRTASSPSRSLPQEQQHIIESNNKAAMQPILPRVWEEIKLLKFDALFQVALAEFSAEMTRVDESEHHQQKSDLYDPFDEEMIVLEHAERINNLRGIYDFTMEIAAGFPCADFERLAEAIQMAIKLREFVRDHASRSPQNIIDQVAKVKLRDRKKGVTCYMTLLIFELSKLSNVLDFPLLLEQLQREIVVGRAYMNRPIGSLNYADINTDAMSFAYHSAKPSMEIMGTEENLAFMNLAHAILEMRQCLQKADLAGALQVAVANEAYLQSPLAQDEVTRVRVEMENYDAGRLISHGLKTGRCLNVVAVAKMRSYHCENLANVLSPANDIAFTPYLHSSLMPPAVTGLARDAGVPPPPASSSPSFSTSPTAVLTRRLSSMNGLKARKTRRVSAGIAQMLTMFEERYLQQEETNKQSQRNTVIGNQQEDALLHHGDLLDDTTEDPVTDESIYQNAVDPEFLESVRASIYGLKRAVTVAHRVAVMSDTTRYYFKAAETILRLREGITNNRWDEVIETVHQDLDLPTIALDEVNAVREGLFLQKSIEIVAEALLKGNVDGQPFLIKLETIEYSHLEDVVEALEAGMFQDAAAQSVIELARLVIAIRKAFVEWSIGVRNRRVDQPFVASASALSSVALSSSQSQEAMSPSSQAQTLLKVREVTLEAALNRIDDFLQTNLKDLLRTFKVLKPTNEIDQSPFYWVNHLVDSIYSVKSEIMTIKEAVDYSKALSHLRSAVHVMPIPVSYFLHQRAQQQHLQLLQEEQQKQQLPSTQPLPLSALVPTYYMSSRTQDFVLLQRLYPQAMSEFTLYDHVVNGDRYFVTLLHESIMVTEAYIELCDGNTSEELMANLAFAKGLLEIRRMLSTSRRQEDLSAAENDENVANEAISPSPFRILPFLERLTELQAIRFLSPGFGQTEVSLYRDLWQQADLGENKLKQSFRPFSLTQYPLDQLFYLWPEDSDLDTVLLPLIEETRGFADSTDGLVVSLNVLLTQLETIIKIRKYLLLQNWMHVDTLLSRHQEELNASPFVIIRREVVYMTQCLRFRRFQQRLRRSLEDFPCKQIVLPRDLWLIRQLYQEMAALFEFYETIERLGAQTQSRSDANRDDDEDNVENEPASRAMLIKDDMSDTEAQLHPASTELVSSQFFAANGDFAAADALFALIGAIRDERWLSSLRARTAVSMLGKEVACQDPLFLEFFHVSEGCIITVESERESAGFGGQLQHQQHQQQHQQQQEEEEAFGALTVFGILQTTNWRLFPDNIRRFFDDSRCRLIEMHVEKDLIYYTTKGAATFDTHGNLLLSSLYLRLLKSSLLEVDRANKIAAYHYRVCTMHWSDTTKTWLTLARMVLDIRTHLISGHQCTAASLEELLNSYNLLTKHDILLDRASYQWILPEIQVFRAYLQGLQAEYVVLRGLDYLYTWQLSSSQEASTVPKLLQTPEIAALTKLQQDAIVQPPLSPYHRRMVQLAQWLLRAIHAATTGAFEAITQHCDSLRQLCPLPTTPAALSKEKALFRHLRTALPTIQATLQIAAKRQWPAFGDESMMELKFRRVTELSNRYYDAALASEHHHQTSGVFRRFDEEKDEAKHEKRPQADDKKAPSSTQVSANTYLRDLETSHFLVENQRQSERQWQIFSVDFGLDLDRVARVERSYQECTDSLIQRLCEVLYFLPEYKLETIIYHETDNRSGSSLLLAGKEDLDVLPFEAFQRLVDFYHHGLPTGYQVSRPHWTLVLLLTIYYLRETLRQRLCHLQLHPEQHTASTTMSITSPLPGQSSLASPSPPQPTTSLEEVLEDLEDYRHITLPLSHPLLSFLHDLQLGRYIARSTLHRDADKHSHSSPPSSQSPNSQPKKVVTMTKDHKSHGKVSTGAGTSSPVRMEDVASIVTVDNVMSGFYPADAATLFVVFAQVMHTIHRTQPLQRHEEEVRTLLLFLQQQQHELAVQQQQLQLQQLQRQQQLQQQQLQHHQQQSDDLITAESEEYKTSVSAASITSAKLAAANEAFAAHFLFPTRSSEVSVASDHYPYHIQSNRNGQRHSASTSAKNAIPSTLSIHAHPTVLSSAASIGEYTAASSHQTTKLGNLLQLLTIELPGVVWLQTRLEELEELAKMAHKNSNNNHSSNITSGIYQQMNYSHRTSISEPLQQRIGVPLRSQSLFHALRDILLSASPSTSATTSSRVAGGTDHYSSPKTPHDQKQQQRQRENAMLLHRPRDGGEGSSNSALQERGATAAMIAPSPIPTSGFDYTQYLSSSSHNHAHPHAHQRSTHHYPEEHSPGSATLGTTDIAQDQILPSPQKAHHQQQQQHLQDVLSADAGAGRRRPSSTVLLQAALFTDEKTGAEVLW